MASPHGVEALIRRVRLRAGLPAALAEDLPITVPRGSETSLGSFSDEEICEVATDHLHDLIAPAIVSLRQDFYLIEKVVPAAQFIEIPPDAMGYGVQAVGIRNPGDRHPSWLPLHTSGDRAPTPGFRFDAYGLELTFEPNLQLEIVLRYFRRPLALTTVGGQVIVSGNNWNWNISAPVPSAGRLSWSRPSPPFRSGEVTLTGSGQIAVSDAGQMKTGDSAAAEGFSVLVQVPPEALTALSQATANTILESLGDANALARGQALLKQSMDALTVALAPRAESAPKVIVPTNVGSRYARTRYGRRGY